MSSSRSRTATSAAARIAPSVAWVETDGSTRRSSYARYAATRQSWHPARISRSAAEILSATLSTDEGRGPVGLPATGLFAEHAAVPTASTAATTIRTRTLDPVLCLLALGLFLVLSIVHTWPLATAPARLSRNDNADTMLNEWILAWVE